MNPPARLAHVCRHPIKSVGHETLAAVTLAPGAALPHDRRWAVAHAEAGLTADPGRWIPKSQFLRGVTGHALMAVTARFDPASARVRLAHPEVTQIDVAPDDPEDAQRLLDWLVPLWPADRPAPHRILRAPREQPFSDMPAPYVAVLGMGSLRALGEVLGRGLSMHRFRGNLWLDGLVPWAEFDLIGREIGIGEAVLRIEERITRCKATTANPETGRADADTLTALEAHYGHHDFGVYATVLRGGTVRPGDPVRL